MSWAMAHWAWSMTKEEEPRCTGEIREYDRNQHYIFAICKDCGFDVAIALPRSRELTATAADGYDPDSRTQSAAGPF